MAAHVSPPRRRPTTHRWDVIRNNAAGGGAGHDKVDAAEPVMTDSDSRLNLCAMCGWCSVAVAVGKYNLQNINTFILLLLHLSLTPTTPHQHNPRLPCWGQSDRRRLTEQQPQWWASAMTMTRRLLLGLCTSVTCSHSHSQRGIRTDNGDKARTVAVPSYGMPVSGAIGIGSHVSYLPIVLNRGSSHDSGKYLLSNAFPGNPRAASAVVVVVISTAAAEEYYVSLSLARWWLCFNLSRD